MDQKYFIPRDAHPWNKPITDSKVAKSYNFELRLFSTTISHCVAIMKTVDLSIRIKCLIEMTLEDQISWLTLDSIITKLTPTLEKSKQIIRALLKEFKDHQSICLIKRYEDGHDISEADENQFITNGVITIQEKDFEDRFQIHAEKKSTEESTNKSLGIVKLMTIQ